MNFFDIKPEALPYDGEYYFNILVIVISFSNELWQEVIEDIDIQGLDHIWYTDQLTEPEPVAICLYHDEELDKGEQDIDFEIAAYPHKVVELSSSYGVSWYDMIDFDTNGPWNLNK